jgi:hypothetical protein
MTTASGSGSSASHRVPNRLRPDLPLIVCGKCKKKIVLEYIVRKEGPNKGPHLLQVSGSQCEFFCHIGFGF